MDHVDHLGSAVKVLNSGTDPITLTLSKSTLSVPHTGGLAGFGHAISSSSSYGQNIQMMGRSSDHGVGGMSSAGEQISNQPQQQQSNNGHAAAAANATGGSANHRDTTGVRSPKSLASPIKVLSREWLNHLSLSLPWSI